MTPSWVTAPGTASSTAAEPMQSEIRARSAQSFVPMPHTACATTATAASFRPCSHPAPLRLEARATPNAKPIMSNTDGSVKQTEATSAPSRPARCMPMANTSWLLAGPGRNWQSATRSP
jgi:hypothetical protein